MATGVSNGNITSAVSVAAGTSSGTALQSAKSLDSATTELQRLIGGASTSSLVDVSDASGAPTAESVAAPTMGGAAFDNLYFFEDEVYRIDKNGRVKFGLVVETSETYSEDEEDDDSDDVPRKGEIRVAWHPDGKEEIHSELAVGLADRTIMPADVVRRLMPGKDTQRGYVRDIKMRADVRIVGTNYVIPNVDAERLRSINTWPLDTAVCLDSWVGSIKAVDEVVVLRSTYGARVEVSSSGLYAFKDVNCQSRRGIFNSLTFCPGQVISGRLHSLEPVELLTPDIPLKKNKKGKLQPGRYTVESVTTESMLVRWQCKALSEDYDVTNHVIKQPKSCVTGEDLKRLKRLNLFESCMQQINDRNYLTISECDTIIKKSEWDKEQVVKFKLLQKEQKQLAASHKSMFPSNIASGASNAGGEKHHEKLKKKLHIVDADKNLKAKKFIMKFEKINKEKAQAAAENKLLNIPIASKSAKEVTYSAKKKEAKDSLSDWISDDDVEIGAESGESLLQDGEDATSTATTISTCSTPTQRSSPKYYINRGLRSKPIKKLRKISSSNVFSAEKLPKVGIEVVTESLLLYSTATVVWQDGSIESGIPSTQLYPIHHLDTHEFFPGDFVISGKEDSDVSYREYGVIQSVDHQGRIARVKWFITYTSAEEAKPVYKGESEMSVYDLKDHPDFQYRPGIMVIRVANFVGEDATCTAGQIIDNYNDGRVKVWWVDGHVSMCWPQDLFEVGQYDQTDLAGNESDDSWETESENSEFGSSSPKLTIAESHILSNVERACVAIARLEEFFFISPNLQNPEVMRKLLVVYKGCRYLDRLLNTNFFHEDHFMGLVERVRKKGTQTILERAQDRKNRLFNETKTTSASKQHHQKQQHVCNSCQAVVPVNVGNKIAVDSPTKDNDSPKVLFNLSSPFKSKNSGSLTSIERNGTSTVTYKNSTSPPASHAEDKHANNLHLSESKQPDNLQTTQSATNSNSTEVCSNPVRSSSPTGVENVALNKVSSFNAEKIQLLSSAILHIEKVYEKTSQIKSPINGVALSQDDSGNCSRNENYDGSSISYASSSDLTNVEPSNFLSYKANEDPKSISCSSIELAEATAPELVCLRLCSLLKDQLLKCISEIRLKCYKEDNLNLSEVFEYIMENEKVEDGGAEKVEDGGAEKEEQKNKKHGTEEPVEKVDEAIHSNSKEVSPLTKSTDSKVDKGTATVEMPLRGSVTSLLCAPSEYFEVLPSAPKAHKFHLTIFHPNNTQQYYKAVHREHRMLRSSLPPGVWVRVFEDRMDLVSVMIEGPKKTPYEDGMFLFDIQLGREYPKSPPLCQYISYCSDRLNPNLYEDGKVCVSLLGTWTGRDSEVWGSKSTLLQVIVSIQGLILVPEPYFNEAGYEKQKGTQQGIENSRMYNEMVIIKMVQATSKLLQSPPNMFRKEILEHYKLNGMSMYERIKSWMELSKAKQETPDRVDGAASDSDYVLPDFPLVPASRGFCLSLDGLLGPLKAKLAAINSVNIDDSAIKTDQVEQ